MATTDTTTSATAAGAAVSIPGYVAGTWTIDPTHTDIAFSVRHLMVSKVRGNFTRFTGTVVTAADPLDSTAELTVELDSIDTRNEDRDKHLRGSDFFESDTNPTMSYRSTGLRADGDDYVVDGELTIKGVTRPVVLKAELNGFSPDPWGGKRLGLSATGEINRSDFGISFNMPLDGGGVVVSERVQLILEVEAVLNA